MIKAILFDFDGVIVNSMPYHIEAWQETFQPFDVYLEPDDVLLTEGCRSIELARLVAERHSLGLTESELGSITRRKTELYHEITRAEVNPDVEPLLTMIRGFGVRTGLVTGSALASIQDTLPGNISVLLDIIVTGDDVEFGKPDPAGYLKAAETLGVAPGQCLVVENAPLGIEAAKRAGMTVLALGTTLARSHLEAADFYADSLSGLLDRIPVVLNGRSAS